MPGELKPFAWLSCGAAVLLLVSPLKLLWARSALGWLFPFLLWLVLIVLGAWLARARGPDV